MAALGGRRREHPVAERSAAAAESRLSAAARDAPQRGGGTPVMFGRRAAPPEEIRTAILAIYGEHNPERMAGVDRLMAQHVGAEAELLAKIVAKYTTVGERRATPVERLRSGSGGGRGRGGSGRGGSGRGAHRGQQRRQPQGGRPDWDGGLPATALPPSTAALPAVAALPLELLRCCMRWLTAGADLGRCACVCRVWRTAAEDDGLWRPLYLATWPAEGDEADSDVITPRRAPGPWRHSFRVRWVRQCEGRLRSYLTRMARVGELKLRRGAANCYDPAPNFGSLRKIVDGLGLSFQVRVNGGRWHAARQLTNGGGRRGELRGEVRGLSCSLRCPAAALAGVSTTDQLLSLEVLANSSLLGRRFVVGTARCRREPTVLESRRGNLPAASELWRLVCDEAVKLYELPMGGCARDKCRAFRPGGVSSSGGGSSSITVVAFEEVGAAPSSQLAPLGGAQPGPASALQPSEGVGAVYCQISHADVVEQLLALAGTRLDPGVPLSPASSRDPGRSTLTGGAAMAEHRLGGRRGSISKSLGSFQGGSAATIWDHHPRIDDLDSRFGLHDYAVGVTLRSFGKTLWEEFFQAVDANNVPAGSSGAGSARRRGSRTRQDDDQVSLVLVSREQAMGAGWDSLGGGGRSMDAPCLLWRSEGGLSGAAAGCVLAEIAVWDDAGELICARTQAVHLAPVAENSADTEKAAALRVSYSELTTFQLKKICREKNLNPAGTDDALVDRLVNRECPPKSRAQDPCLGDKRGSRSDRRNGGAGSSGLGSLDFDTACAEERLLRGTSADRDGDLTLSIELLLEEGGGVVGGKGGGSGGSEVVDLRVGLSFELMREWWGDGWPPAGRAPLPPHAEAPVPSDAAEPGAGRSRRSSRECDDTPQWSNDFTESHKPSAIGLSENELLSMKVSALRDLCELARVPKHELDECLDAGNPKQAYVALLMAAGGGFGDQAPKADSIGSSGVTGGRQMREQEEGQQEEAFGEWDPPDERDPNDIGGGWSSDW